MGLYVDTSAFLKLYLREEGAAAAEDYLAGDDEWYSARHTYVEVRRNLFRIVKEADLADARRVFEEDWSRVIVIELNETTCRMAADIAELTSVRTLDALHLGAACRVGPSVVNFLTFDIKQAQAARQLHFTVLGV